MTCSGIRKGRLNITIIVYKGCTVDHFAVLIVGRHKRAGKSNACSFVE